MAGYARRSAVRQARQQQEAQRRLRTRRPRNWHIASPGWIVYDIDLSYVFIPHLVTVDPMGQGEYPQHKQIVAVDGYSTGGGDLNLAWQHNTGYFVDEHIIVGGSGSNRLYLDEPFVIHPPDFGVYGGQFIRPEVQSEPTVAIPAVGVYFIVETVAI